MAVVVTVLSCKLSRDNLEIGCSPQVAPTPNGSFVQLAKLRSHRELRGAELYESPLPACCITTLEIRRRLHHPTGLYIPWFAGVRFPYCIESPLQATPKRQWLLNMPYDTLTHRLPAPTRDRSHARWVRPAHMKHPTHTHTHTRRHVVSVDGHLDQNTCDYSSNCPFQVWCAALQEHAAPGTRSLTMLLFIQYLYLACNCCDEHPDRFSD